MKYDIPSMALAAVLAALAACDSDPTETRDGRTRAGEDLVAVATLVSGADELETGYLKFVPRDELSTDAVALDDARELPGLADVWVHGDTVFVSSGDDPSITRYSITKSRELDPGETVSFADYGIESSAFWNNTFVSETKAYMYNGASELVVWNPSEMTIAGTIAITGLEDRDGLMPRAALSDRSNVVHDGKVFRPIYWTDEDYAGRTEESVIVVIDTETDEVVEHITVRCTGLDYGTVADDGLLYFSNWTGSVGTRLVLDTPPTCFAQVDPKTLEVKSVTNFAEVTGGHEAAAMKYVGDGKFVFSVFDEARADAESAEDPFELVGTPNFRLWLYDPAEGDAKPLSGVDWNSGAVYYANLGDTVYALVPGADYADTSVYALENGKATRAYDVDGWSLRLFAVGD